MQSSSNFFRCIVQSRHNERNNKSQIVVAGEPERLGRATRAKRARKEQMHTIPAQRAPNKRAKCAQPSLLPVPQSHKFSKIAPGQLGAFEIKPKLGALGMQCLAKLGHQ